MKTSTKKWIQAILIPILIMACGLAGNAERLTKDKAHYHRCQSIKNGVRCNNEALEDEKYCFEDIQNESI